MAISSNSIIHYTPDQKSLIGIINEGFKVKYCCERIITRGSNEYYKAFPMICFCDLPLSHSLDHIKKYGGYGIGLSKEWASKKGINPVQYIDTNSYVGNALRQSLLIGREIHKINSSLENILNGTRDTDSSETYEMFMEEMEVSYDPENTNSLPNVEIIQKYMDILIMNSKNYKGDFERKGNIYKDYKFYDEREWRFILPKKTCKEAPLIIDGDEYIADKDRYNAPLSRFRLEFEFEDISYIIIKQDSNLKAIISTIRKRFPKKNIDILLSKIITHHQIENDF